MRLTFSVDFDGGFWPGPTPAGGATLGEAWVGPAGLLGILETHLGLAGPRWTAAERAASIVGTIREREGFYSRSAESDLLGTAERLLRDRDILWMHGWRGEGLTPRLADLAAATALAPPGFPDRLQAVIDELGKRTSPWKPIERLDLLEPPEDLVPSWRLVVEELERLGTEVSTAGVEAVDASGDLGALKARLGLGGASEVEPEGGDGDGAEGGGFEPRGDGSLELVRGYGPLETADEVAAWLAARADLADTLIIGADEALDDALHRHGLPTTGAPNHADRAASLQILPLVIELLFDPPDPQRVLELVCLPDGPVPRGLAFRLRNALREWPAARSPAWNRAVEEYLDSLGGELVGLSWRSAGGAATGETSGCLDAGSTGGVAGAANSRLDDGFEGGSDVARRQRREERLAKLFSPCVRHHEPIPVAAVQERANVLAGWLRGKIAAAAATASDSDSGAAPESSPKADAAVTSAAAPDAATPQGFVTATAAAANASYLAAALEQTQALRRALDAWGATHIPEPQLRRLVECVTRGTHRSLSAPAQAGLEAVAVPGGMAAPAGCVVWWSFDRRAAQAPATIRLPSPDIAALQGAGIEVPDPGAEALAIARRWARPLRLARRKLILCCPRRDADGEERHPHPLWDEIEAAMSSDDLWRLRQRLIVERPGLDGPAPTEARTLVALPAPRRAWRLTPQRPLRREQESASGMTALVSCPFAWACRYAARLHGADATFRIATDRRVQGSLGHVLLGKVLQAGPGSPEAAEELAGEIFDASAPYLAADLFLPGADAERAETRLVLTHAAAALVRWLQEHDLSVEEVEATRKATLAAQQLQGRIDLVLGPQPAVVDLKYGGRRARTEELENGTACQLAVYGRLLQEEHGQWPALGYFILNTGQPLSPEAAPIPGSQTLGGPHPETTWKALQRAYEASLSALDEGNAVAAGVPDAGGEEPPTKDSLDGEQLFLAAPCKWCRFDALCGRGIDIAP